MMVGAYLKTLLVSTSDAFLVSSLQAYVYIVILPDARICSLSLV